jgi:histidyl-tRNA synthetase
MGYANDKKIPFVILIGEDEITTKKLTLKNMESGEQLKLSLNDLIKQLK